MSEHTYTETTEHMVGIARGAIENLLLSMEGFYVFYLAAHTAMSSEVPNKEEAKETANILLNAMYYVLREVDQQLPEKIKGGIINELTFDELKPTFLVEFAKLRTSLEGTMNAPNN